MPTSVGKLFLWKFLQVVLLSVMKSNSFVVSPPTGRSGVRSTARTDHVARIIRCRSEPRSSAVCLAMGRRGPRPRRPSPDSDDDDLDEDDDAMIDKIVSQIKSLDDKKEFIENVMEELTDDDKDLYEDVLKELMDAGGDDDESIVFEDDKENLVDEDEIAAELREAWETLSADGSLRSPDGETPNGDV